MNPLRNAIFAATNQLPYESQSVADLTGNADDNVRVCVMSIADRDAFDTAYSAIPDTERRLAFRSLLLIYTLRDNDNQPIFTLTDLSEIQKLNSLVVMRLSDVALRLNKMLKADQDTLEKNS